MEMTTINTSPAAPPASTLRERVLAVGARLAACDPAVGSALSRLETDTEAPAGPEGRLLRLVVGALAARHQGAAADIGNLYAGAPGPAEMLRAFEVFVQDAPLVRFAHGSANQAHLQAIGARSSACIVDIGLGMGSQWEPLIRALGQRPGGPPSLHLVGIDLPAPGPNPTQTLDAVGARLAAVAAQAGVPFRFTALAGRVEDLDLPRSNPGESLTINAAFVLHHTGEADRDRTLQRLAATGADALVVCEPEADHDAPALLSRLGAAMHHYGLVFSVLDRCLPHKPDARAVIEGQFFGREIHNILVGEGGARVERHAPAADWSRRLRAAGFVPADFVLAGFVPGDPGAHAELELPDGVDTLNLEHARVLRVDGHPLVTVSAWRPVVGRPTPPRWRLRDGAGSTP